MLDVPRFYLEKDSIRKLLITNMNVIDQIHKKCCSFTHGKILSKKIELSAISKSSTVVHQ
jgi:hypothetical protein